MRKILLSEYAKPTRQHFEILLMSWAGWVFDFYDLILYTFLLIPIGAELGLSKVQLGMVMGASLLATAVGGFLSPLIGWRACFLVSILPALLVVVIRKRLPESDMWLERQGATAPGARPSREAFGGFLSLFSPTHRQFAVRQNRHHGVLMS